MTARRSSSPSAPTGKRYRAFERVDAAVDGENHWDGWGIHVADFDPAQRGEARLSNHKTLQPAGAGGFYETHGFTDDGRLIFSYTADGLPYRDDIFASGADDRR